MRIPHDGLVAVADGGKMLFFRNQGDAFRPRLTLVHGEEAINPPARDQVSDAPGRAFSSVGPGRSAYERADPHQIEEERFAAETAALLRQRALAGDYDALIVVAPPRTLGELRRHYHKEVTSRLLAEVPKNLTGHPVEEIERLLTAAD